jgi:hypothetical protein
LLAAGGIESIPVMRGDCDQVTDEGGEPPALLPQSRVAQVPASEQGHVENSEAFDAVE